MNPGGTVAEAIAGAVVGLVEPGDEVLLVEPYYDSYAACVGLAGGVRRSVQLSFPGLELDVDTLRAAVPQKVIGDLLVGLPGVDQAQHLPFAPGQRRTADQLGHVGAVDDVLDHRLVQRDANGAAEIALLLRQLDQARGALGLGFIEGALVQQALEHADDRLADAQEAADGATAAGQRHGPLQVV
mgnify:CR=1 FL=1